jgi:tetratricopeptide (TPR) repeat protein
VRSYDELAERLRALRAWAGISYRELHRRVVRLRRSRGVAEIPAFDTVHRHLQAGRRRVDTQLVWEIATALLAQLPEPTAAERAQEWRQACQMLATLADHAAVVDTSDRLPADLREFTGRTSELDLLLDSVPAPTDDHTAGPVTWVIHGMAGIGKTSLAVHVAHLVSARGFGADLQLFVNLRGHDPDHPPADPMAVLDGFLRRLGVSGNHIHRLDLAGRTQRLRELLTGRDALLVLDNVADEAQVRPLLPESPTCVVLVTSRRRLDGLPCARHLLLDVFQPDEGIEMLRRSVGAHRVDAEPQAATEIVRLVGGLPLALQLVARRINATSDWSLTDHLERLTERRSHLQLDAGMEVALTSSYDALPPDRRRLLRSIALHPGQDLDCHAAAALAGCGPRTAERGLADLVAWSLLMQRGHERYELHDLVRVFARNRTADEDRPSDRQAKLLRLLAHYTRVASHAMRTYAPHEKRRIPDGFPPTRRADALRVAFHDRRSAAAWLDTERANLIAVALEVCEQVDATPVAPLAVVLFPYLYNAGHSRDAEILLTCASGTSDPRLEAAVLIDLAVLGIRFGRHRQVVDHLHHALDVSRRTGDRAMERAAEITLGRLHYQLGDHLTALEHTHRSLALAQELRDPLGEAQALGNLGAVEVRRGHHDAALRHFERARATACRLPDDPRPKMNAIANLGDLYSRLGRHTDAIDQLHRALCVGHEIGYPPREAVVRGYLGAAYLRAGDTAAAIDHLRRALDIAKECGDLLTVVEVLNTMGEAMRELGEPEQAITYHREALASALGAGLQDEAKRAHQGIARVRTRGDVDRETGDETGSISRAR